MVRKMLSDGRTRHNSSKSIKFLDGGKGAEKYWKGDNMIY